MTNKQIKKKSSKDLEITRKRLAKLARLNKKVAKALNISEIRYRRIFESAQDGILIMDAGTGNITDVNPYLVRLLGRVREEFVGKKLWEIGLFEDVQKSKSAFKELQRDGYIRYDDLPVETWDGRYIDVEFVSSSYRSGGVHTIQCNIRDITERKHAEVEKAILETIEDEQRRIGHDLHDGLCQQLTGTALIAKAMAVKLASKDPAASAEANEVVGMINEAINQTRDLAHGLSPVEIEIGLAPALQKFASTTERVYKIDCVFVHDDNAHQQFRYPPLMATHLYRIVQEAVKNAIQHGKARRVTITLEVVQERGILTIRDNGVGFETKLDQKLGLGLRSMRYRGRMIDARFKVSRDVSGGVVVTCSFPHQQVSDVKHL